MEYHVCDLFSPETYPCCLIRRFQSSARRCWTRQFYGDIPLRWDLWICFLALSLCPERHFVYDSLRLEWRYVGANERLGLLQRQVSLKTLERLCSALLTKLFSKPKREVMDYAFLVDAGRWSVFALQLPTFFVQSVRNWIDVFSHAGGFFAGLLIAMGLHRTSSDGVRHRLTRSNQPSQQYNPHYREDGEG